MVESVSREGMILIPTSQIWITTLSIKTVSVGAPMTLDLAILANPSNQILATALFAEKSAVNASAQIVTRSCVMIATIVKTAGNPWLIAIV